MKKLPISKVATVATVKSLLTLDNMLDAAKKVSAASKKVSKTLDDVVIPNLQKIVDKRNS